jgi:hypothetical protein
MKATFLKGVALGSAVSLATLAATAAFAGTGVGTVFNLGESNRVNARSQLDGSTPSAVLNVTNSDKSGSASGVAIDVPRRNPPLVVNSATKVKNLNADLLDGQSASQFQGATAKTCPNGSAISSVAPNGSAACHSPVVLPIDVALAPGGRTDPAVAYAPSSFALTYICSTGVPDAVISAENHGAAPASVSWAEEEDNVPTRVGNIIINPGSNSGLFGSNSAPQHIAQIEYFDASTVTTVNIDMLVVMVDGTFEGCEFQGTVETALR